MRTLLPLFIASLALVAPIQAGSDIAVITGKSASGRTEVKLEIGDVTGPMEAGSVTIDGVDITFDIEDDCAAVFDDALGVYTIVVIGKPTEKFPNGRYLTFYAVPKTMKKTGRTKEGKDIWTFDAFLTVTEPRADKDSLISPKIAVQCRMVYGI